MGSAALVAARSGLGTVSATTQRLAAAGLTACLALGCSGTSDAPPPRASSGSTGTGTGGAPGGGSGNTSGSGAGGSSTANGGATSGTAGGASPTSGGNSTASSGGNGVAAGGSTALGAGGAPGAAGATTCQMANYTFEPKIPTVFVMVDRSGSMFDCLSTTNVEPSCGSQTGQGSLDDTAWAKLKAASLAVIQSLQDQVRFGFASFTGTNPTSGGTCPMLDQVAPALNNSTPIATLYNSLSPQPNTTQSGQKFETPARQSLDTIGAALLADTSPGDKYILFVTDGQPDYCDDANSLCAPDSVIGGLQALKAKGVTTIVMGLQSASNDLAPGILQAFANAGAGEETLPPVRANQDAFSFYDQCNSVTGWHADLVASGKAAARGVTLGTYGAAAGPTKPYAPAAAEQAAIVAQLSAALSGVKCCTFDLSNVNGQSIKVDLNKLGEASVKVENVAVPLDMTNGWSMASASQLVLNGTACDNWRQPDNSDIAFNFPCNTIIFE